MRVILSIVVIILTILDKHEHIIRFILIFRYINIHNIHGCRLVIGVVSQIVGCTSAWLSPFPNALKREVKAGPIQMK